MKKNIINHRLFTLAITMAAIITLTGVTPMANVQATSLSETATGLS